MTELIVLRVAVVSFFIFFIVIEWLHSKQLKKAYRDGFQEALECHVPQMRKAVDHFFQEFETDLKWICEEMIKDEQRNASGAGATGNTETEKSAD